MPISYTFGDSGFLFVSYSLSESIQPYISYSNEDASGSFQSSSIHYRTESSTIFNSNPEFSISSLGNNDLSFAVIIPSQSVNSDEDLIPLYITSSSPDPFIGFGTSNPLTNLDIRSTTASSPANIILRTNEDGVISAREETGRIIFAIESSSYLGTSFIQSGSTAAIFSRVVNSGSGFSDSTHGSLIFEVNDSTNRTEPIEILTLGVGLIDEIERGGIYTNTNRPIAILSASFIIDDDKGPFLAIRGGTNGVNKIAEIGNITSDATEFLSSNSTGYDKGALRLYNDNSIKIDLNSYGTYSYINDGKLLGIGTTTPTEKLTVQGNISASGTGSFGLIEGGTF